MILTTRVALIAVETIYIGVCFAVVAEIPPEEIEISPWLMVLLSTVFPMAGGLGWALRGWAKGAEPVTWLVLLSTALNMGTLGAGLSMLCFAFMSSYPYIEIKIIGGIGVMSLGGMPIIDWVLDLFKKRIEGEVNKGSTDAKK